MGDASEDCGEEEFVSYSFHFYECHAARVWNILLTYNNSVNWYQRNYPYVWAGARLVRDI